MALASPGGAGRPVPTPIGVAKGYRLSARGTAATEGRAIDGLSCSRAAGKRFGVHLELFAQRLVLIVPAGIGVAPPVRTRGAYVLDGRCSYPVRTLEPTGVVEVSRGRTLTLGHLFAVWGQPLSRHRIAGFRAPRGESVVAFVCGRRYAGDPRSIPLRPHSQIVLEVGGYIPPHTAYRFPKGLS